MLGFADVNKGLGEDWGWLEDEGVGPAGDGVYRIRARTIHNAPSQRPAAS